MKRINLVVSKDKNVWPSSDSFTLIDRGLCIGNEQLVNNNPNIKILSQEHKLGAYSVNDEDLQVTYNNVLNILSRQLNVIHNVDYLKRHWEIIIGPWLTRFLEVFEVVYANIERVNWDRIDRIISSDVDDYVYACNDYSSFNIFINDNYDLLYPFIIKLSNINIHIIKQPSIRNKHDLRYKRHGSSILKNKLGLFNRFNNIHIEKSYLPYLSELKLKILLHQWPIDNIKKSIPLFGFEKDLRDWIIPNRNLANKKEAILINIIPYFLPRTYVEGFSRMTELAKISGRPRQPKVIFTSNSDISDDLFKYYAVNNTLKGCKLIIGQHGGFGIDKFNLTERVQTSISDKFLAWGDWNITNSEKIIPTFIFKTVGYSDQSSKSNKSILHIQNEIVYNKYEQSIEYLNNQFIFISKLNDKILKELIVRPYVHNVELQKQIWSSNQPTIKLDDNNSYKEHLQMARVVVCTYRATTYIESIAKNIPTIIFWDPQQWPIRDEAEEIFNLFREVGIFHSSPYSAASMLNLIWDDVDKWWYDKRTQGAVMKFKDSYARMPVKPLDKLKIILNGF